ncbi:MAG TPA: hypothetical protein VNX47_14095 [Nevskia sp.]|jgi:hypothetical protein|nr:hypothetical protein [Nevskia sp.]
MPPKHFPREKVKEVYRKIGIDEFTCEGHWKLALLTIIPEGEPPRITRERRRSFFAGFSSALQVMDEIGDLPEAEFEAKLGALREEMARYSAALLAGKE